MSITPDQARDLLDGATPGPWVKRRDQDGNPTPVVVSTARGDRHHIMTADPAAAPERQQADTALIAAAPGLAHTIAGMRWEHTFQTRPRGLPWREWTTQEDWFDNHDAAYRAAMNVQDAGSFNCRLVRRLVGPVEVTE